MDLRALGFIVEMCAKRNLPKQAFHPPILIPLPACSPPLLSLSTNKCKSEKALHDRFPRLDYTPQIFSTAVTFHVLKPTVVCADSVSNMEAFHHKNQGRGNRLAGGWA